MNHNYQDSQINSGTCTICKFTLVDHSDSAVCESCGVQESCEITHGNILSCAKCAAYNHESQENLNLHVKAVEVKRAFKEIDSNIKISTDIFNAKTIAINKIKIAIDADVSIANKNFALAQLIESRFLHLKDIIFARRAEVVEAENEQKAIQMYYNELAKKLRTEERERIRLQDVQYKPLEVVIKKPRVITVKKYDADEIKRIAADTGVNAAILQMLCVANNISPVEAARLYKETKSMVK